jgi:hypothetical protein
MQQFLTEMKKGCKPYNPISEGIIIWPISEGERLLAISSQGSKSLTRINRNRAITILQSVMWYSNMYCDWSIQTMRAKDFEPCFKPLIIKALYHQWVMMSVIELSSLQPVQYKFWTGTILDRELRVHDSRAVLTDACELILETDTDGFVHLANNQIHKWKTFWNNYF